MLRYAYRRTPCTVGTVVCSHTHSCTGGLKTLALIPGSHPVRPCPRGIVGVATTPTKATAHPDAAQKGKSRAQRVFKNFVTREGLGVRSGYGTPKTLPNRPDR